MEKQPFFRRLQPDRENIARADMIDEGIYG